MRVRSRTRPCNDKDKNITTNDASKQARGRDKLKLSQTQPYSPFSLPSHTRGGEMNNNDSRTRINQGLRESKRHIPKHLPSRNLVPIPRFSRFRAQARQRGRDLEKKLYRGISSHPLSMWRLSESARLKSFRQYRHLCTTGDVACTVS